MCFWSQYITDDLSEAIYFEDMKNIGEMSSYKSKSCPQTGAHRQCRTKRVDSDEEAGGVSSIKCDLYNFALLSLLWCHMDLTYLICIVTFCFDH